MAGNGMTSTGRGGAGNIADASKSPKMQASDLETPTLKTPVITTGRGGLGNMQTNKDPSETRTLQDVGFVERTPNRGATHVGRGGAANVTQPDGDKGAVGNQTTPVQGGDGKSTEGGLAAKAKGLFKKTEELLR